MPSEQGDVAGLFPRMDLSRRGFVVTSLATGFALSVKPAKATITTDTDGLNAGEVKIPVADGEIPAYRAEPAKPGPHPVVIVIEEIFGVHEHIKDLCRRLAKLGYLAVAPELYARIGDVVHMEKIDDVIAAVNKLHDDQAYSDLDATIAWAGKNGGQLDHLGITGFCRGGRMVWMYAVHNPRVKAAVAWYGPLDGKKNEAFPANPIDVVDQLKVPVLGLYGGRDTGITKDQIDAMKAKIAADGIKAEFIIYLTAEHGFNADYRPSYNIDAATDGWRRMLEWFKANGVA